MVIPDLILQELLPLQRAKWYPVYSPVNRPVDPKQIATEIIYTPAFSLYVLKTEIKIKNEYFLLLSFCHYGSSIAESEIFRKIQLR